MMMITHERLLELCAYDPETGLLTWRKSKGAAKGGKPVGGVHRVKGYGEACIDGEDFQTHRLIWFYVYGEWPRGEIDHINGKRDDNRIVNLRDVPSGINRQNQRAPHRRKRIGLLGAHYNKASGKWAAAICVNYKQMHLGLFETAEEAHQAYLTVKRKLHAGCTL